MWINKIENFVHGLLIKNDWLRKKVKHIYQMINMLFYFGEKHEGDIKRVSPSDEYEYFYGYYDTTPWSEAGQYLLSHRVKSTTEGPAPSFPAEIVMFDLWEDNKMEILTETNAWNNQQGSMLQWYSSDEIIYNDYLDGEFCSIIFNIKTKGKKIIKSPIYTVNTKTKMALTLDFTRLHKIRPGYGYSNEAGSKKVEKIPNTPCVWKVDLEKNLTTPILTYKDLLELEPRDSMLGATHRVNHIMINPRGDRAMLLHRWEKDKKNYSRLVTLDIDGNDLYNLSDDDFVSHCTWKSNSEILSFLNKKQLGKGYYLMKDKTQIWEKILPGLNTDGHPSYSPTGNVLLTDTYPDRRRRSKLYLAKSEKIYELAVLYSPFKFDYENRCDLHPRWNRTGTKVCFDSVFEGKRGVYITRNILMEETNE